MTQIPALNLAGLFYLSADRSPQKEALVWEGGSRTYAQMRDMIESLRPALASDASPFIGIMAYRTPLAYAAVQAILAEGKAYVPLNPIFPAARNAFILRKAGLATLIVGEECADALAELLTEHRLPLRLVLSGPAPKLRALCRDNSDRLELIEADNDSDSDSDPAPRPLTAVDRDRTAYVLFTSGSTGEPKGVKVNHGNVHSYLGSFLSHYPIHPEDRLSQTFDLTFDVSVHDQFVTWAVGATLVVFPDKSHFSPLTYAAEKKVTVWFSVPSRAAFLESARQVIPGALPDVRLSLFAGEKLTWKTCEIWKTIAPNSRLANLYGPTEATVAVTHFEIPPGFPEERAYQGGIPIGRIWPGQFVEVRHPDGSPCAAGEVGGLWLGGDQVAPGYLDEPQKTADRFIQRDGMVWYRTGDLVLIEPDGIIQYLGREDFQVKVMGYRIELGEIEHALMSCSGAAYALADVARIRGEIDEIYCVLPNALSSRKKEISLSMKKRLPSYMVPRHIYFTDEIPLNANGKMDRNMLKSRILAGTL
jgi:D-alanine--poly(phosphoribitol) ligase subunit 1